MARGNDTRAALRPGAIEVGRADENPVELHPSWAIVRGTNVTWASPGGTPSKSVLLPGAGASTVNYSFVGYDWDTIDCWSQPATTPSGS